MLSQEEILIWYKLSESAKANILDNENTPHKPSTHINFHGVILGDLIKASSHKFDFCDNPNGQYKNDLVDKKYHTYNDGDTPMILAKLYNRDKVSTENIIKLISNPNPHSTQGMNELTIDGKLYHQVNTTLSKCPPTTAHIINFWLTGVLMEGFMVSMLLSSIRPQTGMSIFE